MTHIDKLLKKMRINKLEWNIEHFEIIARHFGINVRTTSGSHVIFRHEQWIENLSIPATRHIKPVYVKRFLKLIDGLNEKK